MSQFAPSGLSVPAGFEELLEAVTREILRAQEADIVKFAAEYFKRKVTLRDEGYDPIVENLSKILPSSITAPPKHSASQVEDGRDSNSGSRKESPLLNDDASPRDANIALSPHSDAASNSSDANVTESPPPDPGLPTPDPFTGLSTPNVDSEPEMIEPFPSDSEFEPPPLNSYSPPLDSNYSSPTPPSTTSPPAETDAADLNRNETTRDDYHELNEMDEKKEPTDV